MIPIKAIPIPRVNQFLAHHKVNNKHVPRKIEATLDAKMLNPHMTRIAPMSDDPKYPAGNVNIAFPPCCIMYVINTSLPHRVM